MKKKQGAAVALAAWVLTVTGFMILARSVDLEIYFVLFLIGLLVVVELIDTISATPRYLSQLRYIIAFEGRDLRLDRRDQGPGDPRSMKRIFWYGIPAAAAVTVILLIVLHASSPLLYSAENDAVTPFHTNTEVLQEISPRTPPPSCPSWGISSTSMVPSPVISGPVAILVVDRSFIIPYRIEDGFIQCFISIQIE